MSSPSVVPTGVLILRAWMEGDPPAAIRVRLTDGENSLGVAASVDGVCDAVRRWLADFIASAGGGTAV